MKHVTIRNLPPQVAEGLEKEKRQRGQSLNQTVIDLLRQVLGLGAGRKRSNGLAGLEGTWDADELEEFEAANLLITDRQSEVSGTLRISVPPNIADVMVAPLVAGFQALYPNVVFRVLVTDRYVHLIEDGIDLAMRVGELDDSNLVARRLIRYRHLLVASPEYLGKAGHPKHPQDLDDHPLITFSPWFVEPVWPLTDGKKVEKVLVKSGFSQAGKPSQSPTMARRAFGNSSFNVSAAATKSE